MTWTVGKKGCALNCGKKCSKGAPSLHTHLMKLRINFLYFTPMWQYYLALYTHMAVLSCILRPCDSIILHFTPMWQFYPEWDCFVCVCRIPASSLYKFTAQPWSSGENIKPRAVLAPKCPDSLNHFSVSSFASSPAVNRICSNNNTTGRLVNIVYSCFFQPTFWCCPPVHNFFL